MPRPGRRLHLEAAAGERGALAHADEAEVLAAARRPRPLRLEAAAVVDHPDGQLAALEARRQRQPARARVPDALAIASWTTR